MHNFQPKLHLKINKGAADLAQVVVYYDGASPSTLNACHCEALSNSFDHLPSPSKYYKQ